MFRKKDSLVGLDIGSHSVKMVQLDAKVSPPRLLSLGVVPLAADSFSEGRLKKPASVADAIRRLASHLKIGDKSVAAAVSGLEVMIKKIDLPMMTEEELDVRMQTELGQYIPYNLEEVDVDYQILDISKDRPNFMDVLLVAAKKESINEYVNLIKSAGLEPVVIDVDFFALGNAFEASFGFGDESIALLDIGANKAILNIMYRGVPIFTRGISIGGNQITDRISDQLRISLEEAEKVKLGADSKPGSPGEMEEIFSSVIANWVNEFKRAVNFYYSNFPDNKIDKVFLSGGSCRIQGLERVLQESLESDTEVAIFNPFARIACDPKAFDPAYLGYIGSQMAISLGLALRKLKK